MPYINDDDGRDDWDGQDYTDWIDEMNCADYWYPNEVFDTSDDPTSEFTEEDNNDDE
jgi:hypothetical protein